MWVGTIDDLEVQLAGFDDEVRISFRLPEPQPTHLAIVIDPHRPLPSWPFPAEDLVITGDARFDADAHVVGDVVEALARLDRATRDNLRAWPGLMLHRGRVTVCVSTQRLADQFMGTLRALRHTVAHFCLEPEDELIRLEKRLDDSREPCAHQRAALQALARAGRLDDAFRRRALEHPRAPVRMEAATLGPPEHERSAQTLWDLIHDRRVRPLWRAEAVHRWMSRAPDDGRRRAALFDLLECSFPEVIAASCYWWSQQPDARGRLAGWLRHESIDVRAAAMIALSNLTSVLQPQEEALIIRSLYAYPEPVMTQAALQALRVGGTKSLRAVRDYLESSPLSPEARRTARTTLKALQTRRRVMPGRLAIVDDQGDGQLSLSDGCVA